MAARQSSARRKLLRLSKTAAERPPCLSKGEISGRQHSAQQHEHSALPAGGRIRSLVLRRSAVRLVYLQIFRYGNFEQRAQHQQQRTEEVSASRGIIYDRAGPRTGDVDSSGFGIRCAHRDARSGQHHLSDCPHHQGTIRVSCWPSAKRPKLSAGWRESRCGNFGPHSGVESARHLFSERIETLLSQTRVGRAGHWICGHGRRRPERHRARIRRPAARASRGRC